MNDASMLCILRCEIAFWAAMVNVSVWGSSDHAMKALGVLSWGLVAAGAWLLRWRVERRIRVA